MFTEPGNAPAAPVVAAVKRSQVQDKTWKQALLIAQGDVSRLKVAEDGSVLVVNKKTV